MNYSIWYNVFTGLHYTTLLGGEFANCHGQGSTPEGAVISLKIMKWITEKTGLKFS